MEEKDYIRLIKEYEKLNKARPDIYKLSYNEQIEGLERCLQKYPFTDETKKREIEVLLKWIRNDRSLAKWAYGGVMKDQIRMPDEKNFCQDLAIWQEEHGCVPGKTRHYFPESIDIYNKIRDSKPVCMHLKKEGKQQVLDPKRYLEDYIRENGF